MKKKYIQPTAKMHSVGPSRMCEGSLDYSKAGSANGIKPEAKDDIDDIGW